MIHKIDDLVQGREGVANITRENVGQHRTIGRSDDGNPILEKVSQRRGIRMLNLDGVEVHIPTQCHRVATAESWEDYGRKHVDSLIGDGFIPKDHCPLTTRWSHLTGGGPLVKARDGDKECHLTETQIRAGDWHGCKHYRRVRDARREQAKRRIKAQETATPTQAMLELLELWKAQAAPVASEVIEKAQVVERDTKRE